MFVRDNWYVAAWGNEVGRTLLRRTVLDEPIVLFRCKDGRVAALEDRCPHRFLPLSMGRLAGDEIVCGYHGMTFDGDGRCVRIPGQEHVPPSARVRSFPVEERMGLVWVWTGDPDRCSERPPFDLPQYHDPGWRAVHGGSLRIEANYLSVADNLCDPAHVAFVHASSLGNQAHESEPIETRVDGDTITTTRWTLDAEPIPLFRRLDRFAGNIDRWQIYIFHAPATAVIDFGGADAGTGAPEGRRDDCVWMYACHFLTPVGETATLDNWLHVRNFRTDDEALDGMLNAQLAAAFEEDREVLEAIQREELRRPGKPLRIGIDKGVALMRRVVDRMVAQEQSGAAAAE